MALAIGDKLIDAGLGYVSSNADKIYICSALPTTYTQAVSTYALGFANLTAGAPQAATGGRKVVTNPVTSGTVSSVGMPTYWAIVDSVNSLLLATGTLSGGVTTDISKAWTLGAISIEQTGALSDPYDTSTKAWFAATATAGGTISGSRKRIMDTLVRGLKTDGLWSKLDRLWVFANENPTGALIDLVALDQATAVGGIAFVADAGYFGDSQYTGPTKWIDTTYNPATDGAQYTLNSAHIAFFELTDFSQVYPPSSMGADDGTNRVACYNMYNLDSKIYYYCNGGGAATPTIPPSRQAHIIVTRDDASNVRLYRNGSLFDSYVTASTGKPNGNIFVTAWNNSGVGAEGTMNRYAAASIGAGLTATDATNFYNRLLAYLQAVWGVTNIETIAWLSEVYKGGGTVSSARRALNDTLVTNLKSDGVWAKLDRFWILAAENQGSALVDLKGATTGTAVNSPPFAVDTGYSNNYGAYYFNTNWAGNSTPQYLQDDNHMALWSVVDGAASDNPEINTYQVGYMILKNVAASQAGLQTTAYYGSNSWSNPNAQGFYVVTRGPANVSQDQYRNGVSMMTEVSQSYPPSGGVLTINQRQHAVFSCGGSMTSTQQLAYYNRLRTYLTALGVP